MRKILWHLLPVLLLIGGIWNCEKPLDPERYQLLHPASFEQKLSTLPDSTLLIDVRTPEEFERGHISGAINIDYQQKDFLEKMNRLDKSHTLLIYCRSGRRSRSACSDLLDNNFQQLYELEGGWLAWKEDGYE